MFSPPVPLAIRPKRPRPLPQLAAWQPNVSQAIGDDMLRARKAAFEFHLVSSPASSDVVRLLSESDVDEGEALRRSGTFVDGRRK